MNLQQKPTSAVVAKPKISVRTATIGLVLAAGLFAVLLMVNKGGDRPRSTSVTSPEANAPVSKHQPDPNDFVAGEVVVKLKPGNFVIEDVVESVLREPQNQLIDTATGKVISNQDARRLGVDILKKEIGNRTVQPTLKSIKRLSGMTNTTAKVAGAKSPAQAAADVGLDRWARVFINEPTADVLDLVDRFLAHDAVEAAEPNFRVYTTYLPNDYYYNTDLQNPPVYSWGQTFPDLWGLKRLNSDTAWDQTRGDPSVSVAVIDTGLDMTHPDLYSAGVAPDINLNYSQSNIWVNDGELGTDNQERDKRTNGVDDDNNGLTDDWRGWDYSNGDNDPDDGPTDGHGTHVAGTVTAVMDNTIGVTGACGHCKVMALKALQNGMGNFADVTEAIIYATNRGAEVISMSLGGPYSSLAHNAVIAAYNSNRVVIAAAGNSANSLPSYPGAFDEALGVAASAISGDIDVPASFTNYGDWVDVTAPGVNILSLRAANTDMYGDGGTHIVGEMYYRANGTSMATPNVAGLAALVKSAVPSLSSQEVYQVIRLSSQDVFSPNGQMNPSVYGLVNTAEAVQTALNIETNPLAELVVKNTEVSAQSFQGISSTIAVSARVVNEGFASSGSFQYVIESEGQTLASGTVSDLARDAGTTISRTVTGPDNVMYTIRFDSDNTVVEYNETNNTGSSRPTLPRLSGWPVDTTYMLFTVPTIADLNSDGFQETIITDGQSMVYSIQNNGMLYPGAWPKEIYGAWSSIAVAELDSSYPGQEMVASSFNGATYVLHADGTVAWSQNPVADMPPLGQRIYGESSPAIADLNNDGSLDIIVSMYALDDPNLRTYVFAFDASGQLLPNWSKVLEGDRLVYASPAVADVRPDIPGLEVVLPVIRDTGVNTADVDVYGWSADGNLLSGWGPKVIAGRAASSAVVLGELSSAPGLEVALGVKVMETGAGELHAWQANGSAISGSQWPQMMPGVWDGQIRDALFADLDPFVSGNEVVAYAPVGRVIAWHADGSVVSGWENGKSFAGYAYSRPAAGDINGDGTLEIIYGPDFAGEIHAWTWNGQPVAGFPLRMGTGPQPPMSGVAVGDINSNGRLDIVGAGADGKVYAWEYPASSSSVPLPWPMMHHDRQHTGTLSFNPIAPPLLSVAMTAPLSGTSVSGRIFLQASATASETSINRVDFFRDGVLLGRASACRSTTPPKEVGFFGAQPALAVTTPVTKCFQLPWDSRTVPDGRTTFKARAYDSNGAIAESPLVSVTVDNVAYTATIESPSNGATVSGTVPVRVTSSEPTTFVLLYLDGELLDYDQEEPFDITWDTTTATPGNHVLSLYAFSVSAGSTWATPVTVNVNNAAASGGGSAPNNPPPSLELTP